MTEHHSERVDVSDVSLTDRIWQDSEQIRESLRDILGQLDTTANSISGWSSFLDDVAVHDKNKKSEK